MRRNKTFYYLIVYWIFVIILSFGYFVINNIKFKEGAISYNPSDPNFYNLIVVTTKNPWTNLSFISRKELLSKSKIDQNFYSRNNNLEGIAVPFETYHRFNDDILTFRIKETGTDNWYFETSVDTAVFQKDIPFLFKTPLITNARNKTYTFEIESQKGRTDNFVSVSKETPYFITRSKLSKAEILSPLSLIKFTVQKTKEQIPFITFTEIIILFFLVLLPFILEILRNVCKYCVKSRKLLSLYKKSNKWLEKIL